MPMRKSFLILFLVFVYTWSWSIFNIAKADDYNKAVIGHVISETIKGSFFSEFKFHTKSNEIIPTNTKGNSIR